MEWQTFERQALYETVCGGTLSRAFGCGADAVDGVGVECGE